MGNDTDEGIFGKRKSGGQNQLAKQVRDDNTALALQHKQVGKLATLVASNQTVTADAQRVLLFLASYGDGERMGKFVFSSGELVGLPAAKKVVGRGSSHGAGKVTGSGKDDERMQDDFAHVPASPPTEDGERLGFVGQGPRLNDAVMLLVGRGWAKTTEDGEFGIGTSFNEVSLTEAGRAAAQGAVKKAGLKAGANFADFDGLPGLFDDAGLGFAGGSGLASAATEREQFTAMLSRGRFAYSSGHAGDGDEARTTVTIDHGDPRVVEFSFDEAGTLRGIGFPKVAKPSAFVDEKAEVTEPGVKGRRNDTSGG